MCVDEKEDGEDRADLDDLDMGDDDMDLEGGDDDDDGAGADFMNAEEEEE